MDKKIRDKIFKLLESNENENVTYQDLRIQQKGFLRQKFPSVDVCVKKESELSHIINLIMFLKFSWKLSKHQTSK